ncbi:MAG: transketolase, partial [Pedobacter sp.]
GMALASKLFRHVNELKQFDHLSNDGQEVCFCTIGDASTSEGHFWETVNAAGVLQVPLAIFVWDDGYGISVPKKMQTTKASVSEAMAGFEKEEGTNGWTIIKVKGWDYAGMCEAFEQGIRSTRETHIPVLFHVEEITQPQGHSTSGSHERYKTQERLDWEREWDGIKKMKEWIVANALADVNELEQLEADTKSFVKASKDKAWEEFLVPVKAQVTKAIDLIDSVANNMPDQSAALKKIVTELQVNREPLRRNIMRALHKATVMVGSHDAAFWLNDFYKDLKAENAKLYSGLLYNEGSKSALKVEVVKAQYASDAPMVNGYELLNKYFDLSFAKNPKLIAFGEDLGQIGDVNQGFSGLQEKHGKDRIFYTGIRELTIMGQGIGIALRGLRPIAEIQYLDYLLYGLQPLSDDVATLHYRTAGQQSCPIIVRTRGHRLEGIWHSGSPMGMVINSLRGMY